MADEGVRELSTPAMVTQLRLVPVAHPWPAAPAEAPERLRSQL